VAFPACIGCRLWSIKRCTRAIAGSCVITPDTSEHGRITSESSCRVLGQIKIIYVQKEDNSHDSVNVLYVSIGVIKSCATHKFVCKGRISIYVVNVEYRARVVSFKNDMFISESSSGVQR
jgi:hypothetical protein